MHQGQPAHPEPSWSSLGMRRVMDCFPVVLFSFLARAIIGEDLIVSEGAVNPKNFLTLHTPLPIAECHFMLPSG